MSEEETVHSDDPIEKDCFERENINGKNDDVSKDSKETVVKDKQDISTNDSA